MGLPLVLTPLAVLIALAAPGTRPAAERPAAVRPESSFPCRWNWSLQDGFRAGYITAVNSADCGGRQGRLTLSAQLLRWNPKTKKWHIDKSQTRTWTNLSGNRFVALAEPCVASTVRAVFSWTLRDTGGSVVARHSVKTATLKVPGPDCKISIG